MMKLASKNSQVLVEVNNLPTQLMACRDWNLNTARNTIDVSTISTEWKEYIPGQIESSGSCTLLFDSDNASAEAAIENAQWAGTPLRFYIRPQGSTAGAPEYQLTAIVTQYDVSATTEDAIQIAVSFTGTGPITKGTVSA